MKLFGGKRVHRRFVEVAAGLCAIALSTSAVAAWDAFGDAWLPPQQLSGIGATMSSDIRDREVAIAPDGTVLVVGLGPDGNSARVHARIRKPGARFGATQLLSPPGISASAPQVAVHRDGTALVVWSEGGVAKYAVREPGTRTFGPPRTPTTWTAVDDVRFDGTGAAVIVYRSGATLRAAVRAPDSEFAPSQQLDAIDLRFGNGAISPATLAADGRGTVYAAWGGSYYSTGASGASGPSGSSSYIRAAVRPSGGSFSPAPHLDSFCGPGQCRPYYPTLAASHKAGAVIAWYIETGGLSGAAILRAASLPEGRLLLGGSGFDPLPPVLAVDGLGAVTLGWMEDRLVHLRTRLATGLEQAGPTGEAGSGLRLAADGVGRTFAVWDSAVRPDSRNLARRARGRP